MMRFFGRNPTPFANKSAATIGCRALFTFHIIPFPLVDINDVLLRLRERLVVRGDQVLGIRSHQGAR